MRTILIAGVAVILLGGLILVSRSFAPKSPATAPPTTSSTAAKKEPVLYTAKSCFSQIASQAARWQPDAMPFHMESGLNAESTGQNGKSTVWRAMFASPSRGTWRSFTCSGSRLIEEPPIGVTGSLEVASAPDTPRLMFQSLLLIVDSDKAFETAQENGGAKLVKQNPQQPVLYALNWDAKNKQLVWAVLYGTSFNQSKGIGVVDATSGKFLRAAK